MGTRRLLPVVLLLLTSGALADGVYLTDGVAVKLNLNGTATAAPTSEVTRFKSLHPCPVPTAGTTSCIGFKQDYIIPLLCRGAPVAENMYWRQLNYIPPVGTTPARVCGWAISCK